MKKKYALFFILFFAIINLQAKNKAIRITDNTPAYTIVEIMPGELKQKTISTPNGDAIKVFFEESSSYLQKGSPDVPKLTFSLALPANTWASYEIVESNYVDYTNIEMVPSKGQIIRTQKPSEVPYVYGEVYNKNAFFPNATVEMDAPYILRDIKGQALQIFPVQYNAVTKIMRVYSTLKIKINYINSFTGAINTEDNKPEKLDETFYGIYQNQFVNFNSQKKTRYTPITENGSLLIISPASFIGNLSSYIQWKEMKGFKTYLVNADTISGGINEASIRSVAKYYYDNMQIAYMILVGDNGNIPAANDNFMNPNLAGPSDISYAYISGNDHYPEFIVGRFSGENTDEIQNIVNRTMAYEKTPNATGDWMSQQIGIASEEGTGDDNQYDYEHIHDIVDSNKNQYNYVNYYELYDGNQSQGWNDAAGYPNANDLESKINSGVSLINYTGHGTANGIVTTSFSISEVPNLTNQNKLPFFLVVGCSPGRFYNQTCFAESLIRTGNGATQYGTISNFMSSIDQYWDEPMQAQDEFNAIMRGARPNNLQSRLGAMCVNACCSMNDQYNTQADPTGGSDMTDTWIFFGDPTVSIYNKNAGTLTCTHTTEIGRNATWYSVNCPVDGATIGLYYQGKFLASSKVIGGSAQFNFPAVANLDTIFITATKQNYQPYSGYTKVVDFPVNISDVELSNHISLYPNPADDFVNITLLNNEVIENVQLADMSGKIVFSKKINDTKYSLDIKSLPKANYNVNVKTNRNQYSAKLSIK